MSWTHTRWSSVFATILSLYFISGTNGQGSSIFSSTTKQSEDLSTAIDIALTSTPTAVSDMQQGSTLIYIGSIVGVAVIVTAIVMLICCLCLCYKKRKMRTLQPNRIKDDDSNGNMEPYTLQCYRENKFEWKDFELADPETTSFGVPSNVNSRAPSLERESLEYEEILPENFNPPQITNPSTTSKSSSTFPQGHITRLLPQVQCTDSFSGIKQATSMSALCQQQQSEAKPSTPVPYHQHLSSLPRHTVSISAKQYYSMKDLPGAALREQHGPCQATPKGESLYDIPRAALEARATEFARSYQGDTSERVNTQMYYDVPKQVVVAMREKTSLHLQENDTEVTTAMPLDPSPWNTSEALMRPVPIPASIPKPFQQASFAVSSHAPATSNVSTTAFTTDTCCTYDVPKQVQSNTEQEETKLLSTSKNREPASMSEHGSKAAFLRADSTSDTPVSSSEPATATDADHYDVPKRLVANRVLTQYQSSSLQTHATSDVWIPHVHLTAKKLSESSQDDIIYDMPKLSTPQRTDDEVDSVEDQHIYDLPPTEVIQELRQKRANNHGYSYQPPSATEECGSSVRYEAEPLDEDIKFINQLAESKRKSPYNMATDIEHKPSLDEKIPQSFLQELAVRNLKGEVDTHGYN